MKRRAEAELTLHIRSSELCSLPTAPLGADQFVAQLSSVGLGSASYVVGRRDPLAPEWIVLDYAAGGHERVWRQTRSHSDGVLTYALVEDDSSSGYVTVA